MALDTTASSPPNEPVVTRIRRPHTRVRGWAGTGHVPGPGLQNIRAEPRPAFLETSSGHSISSQIDAGNWPAVQQPRVWRLGQ